jgi:hypothetical protein
MRTERRVLIDDDNTVVATFEEPFLNGAVRLIVVLGIKRDQVLVSPVRGQFVFGQHYRELELSIATATHKAEEPSYGADDSRHDDKIEQDVSIVRRCSQSGVR